MTLPTSPATDIATRIRRTAQELVAEGTWPTVNSVRERLGTGSNTTINNELRVWRQWFLSKIGSTARRPGWPAELGDAMDTLWQMACEHAEKHLDEVRQEVTAHAAELEIRLKNQKDEFEACRNETARDLEVRDVTISDLKNKLEHEVSLKNNVFSDLEVSRQAAARLEEKLIEEQREHRSAMDNAQTVADERLAAEKAEGERREAQAYERLEGLRIHLYEQMEKDRKEMAAERQRQESQIEALRREMAAIQNAAQDRLLESERARAATEAEVVRLRQDASALLVRLSESETRASSLQDENRQLQADNTSLALHLSAEQEQLAALRFQAEQPKGQE